MAAETKIEWCDSTFNPWIGCTRVSPACDRCYAAVSTPARTGGIVWGAGQARRRTSRAYWKLPLRWNSSTFFACAHCGWRGEPFPLEPDQCAGCGRHDGLSVARRRVFCASLADVFDNEVPGSWRADLFNLIRATPNLDWLLLTKRIGNAVRMLDDAGGWGGANASGMRNPLPNVWLGATICNQPEADRDILRLLRTPAAVRWVSLEPLLEPVRLWKLGVLDHEEDSVGAEIYALSGGRAIPDCDWKGTRLDWVVAGGESGKGARPMHPDWARSLRDQCAEAGVPFLFKQWGEWAPAENRNRAPTRTEETATWINGAWQFSRRAPFQWLPPEEEPDVYRVGKKSAGRLLDGVLHDGFPVPR